MVSEALIPMQVSESLVTIPAKWPGILNFLFGSKRISHRGIDEVCVGCVILDKSFKLFGPPFSF